VVTTEPSASSMRNTATPGSRSDPLSFPSKTVAAAAL
jgi:hypothetical protein